MILYYAVGGGLGHLTRARAVLQTLGGASSGNGGLLLSKVIGCLNTVKGGGELPSNAVSKATGFPMADDIRVLCSPVAGADCVFPEHQLLFAPETLANAADARVWVRECLDRVQPQTLFIDTFPGGIFGELCELAGLPGIRMVHIARLLRWPEYSRILQNFPLRFDATYFVEELHSEHDRFLRRHSVSMEFLTLAEPPEVAGADLAQAIRLLSDVPSPWLIVHSGADDEIHELIAYAMEMQAAEGKIATLFLLSPRYPSRMPATVTHLSLYPAHALFPHVSRIITACGFNVMRQTEPYCEKHRFVPFERRWDDQFLRAARRRQSN